MSDQDETTTADTSQDEATTTTTADETTTEAKPPWGSDEEFDPKKAWNLIQNLRGDLDKAKPAMQRVKELEDASKTEAQRLAEARDEHKTRAEKAEGELLRLRVGLAKGLTEAQAKRLVGSTKEELEADADDLLASFGTTGKSKDSRPTTRLRGGGEPDDEPTTDAKKVVDSLPRF